MAEAGRRRDERLDSFGPVAWTSDPAGRLADLQCDIAATRKELTDVRARLGRLMTEPALLAQPAARLAQARDSWRARQAADPRARRPEAQPLTARRPDVRVQRPEAAPSLTSRSGADSGIRR